MDSHIHPSHNPPVSDGAGFLENPRQWSERLATAVTPTARIPR